MWNSFLNLKIAIFVLLLIDANEISPNKKNCYFVFVRCFLTELSLTSEVQYIVSIVTMLSSIGLKCSECTYILVFLIPTGAYTHTIIVYHIGKNLHTGITISIRVVTFECVLRISITNELSETECALFCENKNKQYFFSYLSAVIQYTLARAHMHTPKTN